MRGVPLFGLQHPEGVGHLPINGVIQLESLAASFFRLSRLNYPINVLLCVWRQIGGVTNLSCFNTKRRFSDGSVGPVYQSDVERPLFRAFLCVEDQACLKVIGEGFRFQHLADNGDSCLPSGKDCAPEDSNDNASPLSVVRTFGATRGVN